MNAQPAALSSKEVSRTHEEIRHAQPEPPRTRDRLLQRVLVARKRLPQTPASRLAKTR
jgi:hypothetical protein